MNWITIDQWHWKGDGGYIVDRSLVDKATKYVAWAPPEARKASYINLGVFGDETAAKQCCEDHYGGKHETAARA